MKQITLIILFLSAMITASAQIDAGGLMGLPTATTIEMNNITGATVGQCLFNTDDEAIYFYTASGWQTATDEQALSLAIGNILTLEDGGTVNLTPFLDNTDNQTASQVNITDAGNVFTATNVEDALTELAATSGDNIYTVDGTLTANRGVAQGNFDLNFDANTLVVSGNDNRVGIGTNTPAGTLEARSAVNENAFYFVQANNLTGERDVFTIEDQDTGGGGQDGSSVFKVLKSGPINVGDNGFSLIELANTGVDPGANKYWISGRKVDEDAPLWGVDITDNDFWSEGGITLGVTGAANGTYSGGNFVVTNTGQITSNDLSGTGTRMVVADASGVLSTQTVTVDTDNQTASEVDSDTPVDVDGDGNTEATVEDVIQDIAPITSASGRIFYPPSIEIDASSDVVDETKDLYAEYVAQFASVNTIASTGAPSTVPIYAANELYYYVTYFDPLVFANITIDANGVMEYDIIGRPVDYNSLINIVFVVK